MKYKYQIFLGAFFSFLVWIIFVTADFIDELLLKEGTISTVLVFIIMPFFMLILYAIHYIRKKPMKTEQIIGFVSYYTTYFVIWAVIIILLSNNKFIPQSRDPDIIDLNGIEYILYGFSTLLFFSLLCIIFHIIYNILKRKH